MNTPNTSQEVETVKFGFTDGILLLIGLIFIVATIPVILPGQRSTRFILTTFIYFSPIWLAGVYLVYIKVRKLKATLKREPQKIDTNRPHIPITWRTKLSAGLLWIIPLPYIWYGIFNVLYMTVWDKPGYQMGEQFAIIWVIVAIFAILIFLAMTLTLLQRSKTSYFLVVVLFIYNIFTSITEVSTHVNEFTKYKDIIIRDSLFSLVGIIVIILLILDRSAFFQKSLAP